MQSVYAAVSQDSHFQLEQSLRVFQQDRGAHFIAKGDSLPISEPAVRRDYGEVAAEECSSMLQYWMKF